MRTGFGEHLFAGVILFVVVLAIVGIPSGTEFVAAGVFFFVGAVLPDLDSPVSKPRRIFRWVALIAGFAVVLFLYPQLSSLCEALASRSFCAYFPILSISMVLAAVYLADLVIPIHRGFFHTFRAALLYGVTAGVLALYSGMTGASLRIGAWAAGGYVSHILVDMFGDAIPFK